MSQLENELKQTVARLLADGEIGLFIGYGDGLLPLRSEPLLISEKEDVKKLVWNSWCSNNLAVYLSRLPIGAQAGKEGPLKIGILAKGCDGRSIVGLVKERQVDREKLFIIGCSCPGIVDVKKIEAKLGRREITRVDETKKRITILDSQGDQVELEKERFLCEPCFSCNHPAPVLCDILIGEEQPGRSIAEEERRREFESGSIDERWNYFEKELSKCIRCYACRNVCPNCYCKECFAEQTKPRWLGVTTVLPDVIFYHIGRIFHQAGRCVDCGACVRACPMDIDLRLFTRRMVDEVKDRFGYEAGLSLEEPAPLAVFSQDDSQEFMTEPG